MGLRSDRSASPRSAPVRASLYTAEQRSRRDLEIESKLATLQSEWGLGKRMERDIARSQGVPFVRGLLATPHNGESPPAAISARWAPDAEKGLRKIPFFARGKVSRNTERYAQFHSVPVITVETL